MKEKESDDEGRGGSRKRGEETISDWERRRKQLNYALKR
jgi:hypothetical protein